MTLNLESFEKAITTLKEAIDLYAINRNTIIRDGLIQRFEYTYELAFKNMARFIQQASSSTATSEKLTFNEIIRMANDFGITKSELRQWKEFKDKRNLSVHTYDENNALAVADIIPAFLDEAEYILQAIKSKQKDT